MKPSTVAVLSLNNVQTTFWANNLNVPEDTVIQFKNADDCLAFLQNNSPAVLIIDSYFCRNEDDFAAAKKIADFSKIRTWVFTPDSTLHTSKNVLVKYDYFSQHNLEQISSLVHQQEAEAA